MTPHRVVHILGGEYVHIKAIGSTPIPLQSSINFIPCIHFCVHGLLNEGGYYCINPGEHVHVHTIHTWCIRWHKHAFVHCPPCGWCLRSLDCTPVGVSTPLYYVWLSATHIVHQFITLAIILLSYIQVYPLSDITPRRHCWGPFKKKVPIRNTSELV